ncbi:MAG: polysaccharide deacetylase family protein [Candidatus Bathyarchaeia archaeon]
MVKMVRSRLLLTFDVEDFINTNAIYSLLMLLRILNKYQMKAIFFITGHMAEKIANFPEIIDLLKNHEIGYHSSSHSVHPTIPEYTDVKSYEKAYEISIEREISHINPLTGEIEGEGGICFLQSLFHPKKIQTFRAPGMCWTPPHLEALRDLGIQYDFSTDITISEHVNYRGITLYPHTFIQQWSGSRYDYQCLLSAILKRKIAVFDLHPTLLVNQNIWDNIYSKGNPTQLIMAKRRPIKEIELLFKKFELLLRQISLLRKVRLIETDPTLNLAARELVITNKNKVREYYESSMRWPRQFFGYKPKFILNHFFDFFDDALR